MNEDNPANKKSSSIARDRVNPRKGEILGN